MKRYILLLFLTVSPLGADSLENLASALKQLKDMVPKEDIKKDVKKLGKKYKKDIFETEKDQKKEEQESTDYSKTVKGYSFTIQDFQDLIKNKTLKNAPFVIEIWNTFTDDEREKIAGENDASLFESFKDAARGKREEFQTWVVENLKKDVRIPKRNLLTTPFTFKLLTNPSLMQIWVELDDDTRNEIIQEKRFETFGLLDVKKDGKKDKEKELKKKSNVIITKDELKKIDKILDSSGLKKPSQDVRLELGKQINVIKGFKGVQILKKEDKEKTQKIIADLEKKKSAMKGWGEKKKEALKNILSTVQILNPELFDRIQSLRSIIEVQIDKKCELLKKWLNEKDDTGQTNKVRIEIALIDNEKQLDAIKTNLKQNPYGQPLSKFFFSLKGLYDKLGKSQAGRMSSTKAFSEMKVKNEVARLLKMLGNVFIIKEKKQALLDHIRLLVVIDPSSIIEALALEKRVGIDNDGYALMLEAYKHAVNYIRGIAKLKKLSGGNLEDFEFGVNFMSLILPFIEQAKLIADPLKDAKPEDQKKAQAFVQKMMELQKYLTAILCKNKVKIESAGFDFDLFMQAFEDETQRDWCAWYHKEGGYDNREEPFEQLITAPGGRHITYNKEKVSDKGYFSHDYPSYEPKGLWISKGSFIPKPEREWITVDKSKPFYKRFYAELHDTVKALERYEKDEKRKKNVLNQAMREAYIINNINRFNEYFALANRGKLCSMCFDWDLRGGGGDGHPQYRANMSDGFSIDSDGIEKRGQQVKEDLQKIEDFLKKRDQKNPFIKSALDAVGDLKNKASGRKWSFLEWDA